MAKQINKFKMLIQKSRIRKIDNYLPTNFRNEVVLSIPIKGNEQKLEQIGFYAPYTNQKVLPDGIAPISRFNAYGKEKIRKDLGKESVDIPFEWCREQWCGYRRTEHVCSTVYRTYDRWVREFIAAPEVCITSDEDFVYSPAIPSSDTAKLTHTTNLFLELFGEVVVNSSDKVPLIDSTKIEKVNWKILPTGKTPWEKVEEQIRPAILKLKPNKRRVFLERLRFIHTFSPDFKAVGEGGFSDYIVLGFNDPGIFVFECVKYGNAMYVLRDEWKNLSQVTKAELINSPKLVGRVIHSKNWIDDLNELIGPLIS